VAFFPDGVFGRGSQWLHQQHVRSVSSYLISMYEPALYPPVADRAETYRLLFEPPFEFPVVVRISRAAGAWRLVCKWFSRERGSDGGAVVHERERDLSPDEAREFEERCIDSGFWSLPTLDRMLGADGSTAIVEGVVEGRYHVVERWCPEGTPFASLVALMLGLARAS
jgi:hypothetical protein